MIIFYNKKTGEVIGTIDGRVHNEDHLKMYIDNGCGKKNIGKYIIGWTVEKGKKIPHHPEKFELLKKFEDNTPESPLRYKLNLKTKNLVKKRKLDK